MFGKQIVYALLASVVLIAGCEEDRLGGSQPVVITEQVLFISGEQARLSGRLVTTENQNVTDHGFLLSTNESFSNPITVSLGERTKPGRFIGETSELSSGTLYYWKPYVNIQNGGSSEVLEGKPAQVTTLVPKILSFSPTLSSAGQFIFITGNNFTSDTRVFFDDREAPVLEIDREAEIKATIPTIGDSKFSTITIVSQDTTLTAEGQFEYITGKWEAQGNFITDKAYSENFYLKRPGQFVFGLGFENSLSNQKVWALDLSSFQWSQLGDGYNPKLGPFYASDYIGGGLEQVRNGVFSNTFFTLESDTLKALNPLSFNLYQGVAFEIGGVLYVAGGLVENNFSNGTVYRYIEAEDSWEDYDLVNEGLTSDNPYFVYNGLLYFMTNEQNIFTYDPATKTVSLIGSFPSNTIATGKGITEVIGDKAYIGLFNIDRTLWEYDIPSNSFKRKTGFSGGFLTTTVTSFTEGGVIYVVKNPEANSSNGMSIWSFKPEEF